MRVLRDNRAVQPITVGKSGENSATESSNPVEDVEEISPELEKKFVRRLKEGYDLYDPVYTRWLQRNHPESIQPTNLQAAEPTSIAEEFSHITPLSPEAVLVDEIDERSAESRQVRVEHVPEMVNSSFTDRREAQNCGSDGGGVMERRGGTVSSSLATVLADHTPQVATTQRCKPKARLLTSAECLKMLQEKEDKKKQQLEEKERKRKEREHKKILREQETQRKKEEKARKAQKKVDKAAMQKSSGQAKRNIQATRQNPNKRLKANSNVQATEDDEIDVNVCCMCFGSYEDDVREGFGAEWMKCPCGRWLHVECIEDSIVDSSGQSRFCPYCVDGL